MEEVVDLFNDFDSDLTEKFWGKIRRILLMPCKETVDMRRKQLVDKMIFLADSTYYSYQNIWTYADLENAIRVILPFVGRDMIWAHAKDFSSEVKISRVKGNLYWKSQNDDEEKKNEKVIAFQVVEGKNKGLCIIQPEGEDQPLVWQTTDDGGEYFVTSIKRLLGLGVVISMLLRKMGLKSVTWPDKLFCVLYYVVSGKGWKMYSQIVNNDLAHRYTSKADMPLLEKAAGGKYFYSKLEQAVKEVGANDYKMPTAKKAPKAYASLERYLIVYRRTLIKDDYQDAEMLSSVSDYTLAADTQLINAIEGALHWSFKLPPKNIDKIIQYLNTKERELTMNKKTTLIAAKSNQNLVK